MPNAFERIVKMKYVLLIAVVVLLSSHAKAVPFCSAGSYPVWNGFQWICK